MALKLHPTGLGAGIDKDQQDFTSTAADGLLAGSMRLEVAPDHLRWFWSFTITGPMTRLDKVATLEEAKAQVQNSWDAWKTWAGLQEVP